MYNARDNVCVQKRRRKPSVSLARPCWKWTIKMYATIYCLLFNLKNCKTSNLKIVVPLIYLGL